MSDRLNLTNLPPEVTAIVEAAVAFYQASGGVPALTAAKQLDAAVVSYLLAVSQESA